MNDNKHELHAQVGAMIGQFSLGAHLAVEMFLGGRLSFDSWYEEVARQGGFSNSPVDHLRLIWIWESLRKDPILKYAFHDLSPAGAVWNRGSGPLLVLNRENWLVIGLQQHPASALLVPSNKRPQDEIAAIQLLDDLYMKPGRNDRLECCDCRCLLYLRPDELHAKDREVDILGVRDEQVKLLGDRIIQIEVPSINQAYTVASRRMEPYRRSHGGNIYDHVVYVGDQGRFPLEDIRLAVESGEWGLPMQTRESTAEYPLFPEERD